MSRLDAEEPSTMDPTAAARDLVVLRVGAWAAFLTAIIIPIQVVVFITNPLPATVDGWLSLLAEKRLAGLIDLDLLLVVDNLLAIALLVALFVALEGRRDGPVLLATVFGIVGAVLYVTSNPALGMLAISDQYAAAASDAARASAYAAAQATVASLHGTAFHASYVVGSLALIVLSVPMIRSPLFGRLAGWLGIGSNVVAFGLYVPGVGLGLAVLSVFGLEVWYVLVGWGLYRGAAPPPRSPQSPPLSERSR